MKTQLAIGVRELVEHVLRCGDLESEFAAASRAVDAIRVHQRIQNSRPAEYCAEVAVSRTVETDRTLLTIGGRIDGVFSLPALPVVEEIKTTRRSLEDFTRSDNPLHWGQAQVYAFLYAESRGLAEIEIQLTYARLDTLETREIRRRFATAELKLFFEQLTARYLAWADRITDWCRMRDDSIKGLAFPFEGFRPGQLEMTEAVDRAIRSGERLFIQAATGIGKTMAVLFPTMRTIADRLSRKVFYLTARTTGRRAAEQALDELRARGLRLKGLTLTARERICFLPDRSCTAEECEFAKGHYDRLPDARAAMFELDAWTREAVTAAARHWRVCPFEFSLDLALWADLIVCDYNYAFDPKAYLRRFFMEDGGDYTFLVDEAHNLVDRSREMFSAEIRKQPFLDLRRSIKKELPAVFRLLGRINTWMLSARKRCTEAGGPLAERSAPEEIYPQLRDFLAKAEHWLEKNVRTGFREEMIERYFEASGFLRVAERFDETYAACSEVLPQDFRLKLYCIDPSRQFGEALLRCRAAVFFSATLTPMDYFTTMLGCEHAGSMVLASPFPPDNLKVLVANRISTLFRHRDHTKADVARILEVFVSQKRGNYLLFFPSYDYLRMVLEQVRWARPATESVVQEPGMSERQRDAFLARFEVENPATLVGFAVMGGIFGEGIDLVGTRLSGAAVVGVGLPAICLERELIKHYFADRLEEGFEYAYVYPGINRVLQAAGRVIRSETDRGALLLIDPRYATPAYRALLPESWRTLFIRDPARIVEDLQEFWCEPL